MSTCTNKKGSKKAKVLDNHAAPDFIQKLFRMLEEKSFRQVFFWTESGTSFIVQDTNAFSRQLLPQYFKHSNFASFVRQLNKYGFHKVRNGEDTVKPYGDQAWEFVHPKFMRDRKDLLESIKRKVPGKTKDEVPSSVSQLCATIKSLQQEIDRLKKSNDSILNQLKEKDDLLMKFKLKDELSTFNQSDKLWTPFNAISKKHTDQTNTLKDQLELSTVNTTKTTLSMSTGSFIDSPIHKTNRLTLVPLGKLSSNLAVQDNTELMPLSSTGTERKSSSSSQVSWTVPPRILLVDDDSVYRDLSVKLLSVIGCTIDLAKDGVEALKKMRLEKYDLILMDIVMPKMDGISATRSIRQYDTLTPIISMTSSFSDSDIMKYIGSGMTDILPKPFTRRTLYQILEKYCAHLKTAQKDSSFPLAPIAINPTVNSDVTIWPRQPPFDRPPPAIIPNSNGKFIRAEPDRIIQKNKKARLDQL